MISEIALHSGRRVDFGFETTLSGRTTISIIGQLKKRGYGIHVFYLWIPSVDTALQRIRERAARGGHSIPDDVVRRRFDRSLRNFLVIYRILADSWILFNNSDNAPSIIALEKESTLRKIDEELLHKLISSYGAR